MRTLFHYIILGVICSCCAMLTGCTVKAVGDPNRPITINAHVTLDIKGLKQTADNIEDYVSGDASAKDLKVKEKK